MSLYDMQQALLKGNMLTKDIRKQLQHAVQRLALWESPTINGFLPTMPKYLDRKMQNEWDEIESFAKRTMEIVVAFDGYGWTTLAMLLRMSSALLYRIRDGIYIGVGRQDQKTLNRVSRNVIISTQGKDEARHDGDRIDDKFAVVETDKLYKLAYWAAVSCSEKCNGLKSECEMLDIMREFRIPAATGYERCPYWADEQGSISEIGIKLAVVQSRKGA